jgi:hypothetical protein
MFPPTITRDPTAVEEEVRAIYLTIFPAGDPAFVSRAFGWVQECFRGDYSDYQAVDAPYHDLEHTLQGTLCMARLLFGRHLAGAEPRLEQRYFELGLLAILLHDTGYLKRRDDTEGTGAKYTVTHVDRSARFASALLAEKGFSPADCRAVENMIHCTGVDATLGGIAFGSEQERIVGHALGTGDLLGQMAAEDYPEKLPVLYSEFAEAARYSKTKTHFVASYSNADELMRKTPDFWAHAVQLKLTREFGGLFKFLNNPYPAGPNYYLDRIEANMERVRHRIGDAASV